MRLTTNKKVTDMGMFELAHNCCYIAEDGNGRYRDYEMDIDERDFTRKLMSSLTGEDLPLEDESFDEEMAESLMINPLTDVRGLIALFYRNMWAMADLREKLKRCEDAEERGAFGKWIPVSERLPEEPKENGIFEVEPSTICQYTRLKDKNGKLIWENDIVDGHIKRGAAFRSCVVLWNECKARFDIRAVDCNFPMTLDECVDDISVDGLDYEVLGNKFDNPELLEVRL